MASLFIIALILFATVAISLASLLSALLVRSLCRRRRLRSRADVTVESVLNSPLREEQPNYLNYFLFWKKQLVRVEPAPTLSIHHKSQDHGVEETKEKVVEVEEEEDVVAKWQAMHGGTRFLYTIKEEDREGENSVELFESIKDGKITRLCLADVLSCVVSEVEVSDDLWEEATPTRPPMYHTPSSPSPSPNNN